MTYAVNLPYSVMVRPNGPALYAPSPRPIPPIQEDVQGAGYFIDAAGIRATTGSAPLDFIIKWGFWVGMAAILYKSYRILRYDEPFFLGAPRVPAAWEVNSSRAKECFYEEYENAKDVMDLALKCKVSPGTIYRWIHEAALPIPRSLPPGVSQPMKTTYDRVLYEYEPGMNVTELAERHNVSASTVRNWLKAAGVYVPAPKGRRRSFTGEEQKRRAKRAKRRGARRRSSRSGVVYIPKYRNPEGEEMLRVCAWCKRVWRDGRWQHEFIPETVQQTHGICEDCERVVYSAIDEDEADERARR